MSSVMNEQPQGVPSGAAVPPMSTEGKLPRTLLSVQDLHVWFELKRFGFLHAGYVQAVDGVNFDLRQGGAIGIVGESGCGKTTLMKTILGLYQPIKGKVVFQGEDLSELTMRDMQTYRGKVGYVQQDPYGALPPFMTVEQILAEPMIVTGVKDRIEHAQRIRD
ncbi:MAG: ATP-binding cassette domain-containing protein, partial [Anaerolineae bacterium]|nr:ATP-binding cassette domain-containing protein [Anaerolineae bacterium]